MKSALEGPEAVKAVSENYNIRWHYASYFLSFGPKVFRHRLFTNFWKKYQKTNRRQATIRRGEMALSGCLKAIVGETHLPRPLLNNDLIASEWDKQNLGEVPFQFIPTGPTATVTDLKRPMKDLYSGYLSGPKNVQIHITAQPEDNWQPVLCLSKATTISELSKFLDQFGFETNHDVLKSWFLSYILSDFRTGSQIHNASILAIPCGIPIVKLDVIFRGSLSWDNIESVAMQLPKHQQHEFLSIFGKHRYGASFLAGWRLTGFRYHLI